ncbi:MAG: hypothetical protein ACKOEQ_10015 [Verrucomicrobiota bacterium]
MPAPDPAVAPAVALAIALGDVTGVGPEVAARAVAALPGADPTRFVVFGCRRAWARAATSGPTPVASPSVMARATAGATAGFGAGTDT